MNNLTPKEEAELLVETFYNILYDTLQVNTAFDYCKRAAEICVDKILSTVFTHKNSYDYWKQVNYSRM